VVNLMSCSGGPDVSLGLRHGLPAGLPLVGSSLAFLHHIAFDVGASIVLGWLPGQEDALISPLQVLWGIRHSWTHKTVLLSDTQ